MFKEEAGVLRILQQRGEYEQLNLWLVLTGPRGVRALPESAFFLQSPFVLLRQLALPWGPVKKHALSGKARTAVLYAAIPRSSQVEVPNRLTTRVGVQGRMTHILGERA
jgi:hypothetical protein